MSFRIIATFVIFLFSMRVNAQTVMPSEPLSKTITVFELPPFERAVCCIKYYEGLHRKKDYPYVGYGHRLQPGERYSSEMTATESESLLRKDLKELCSLFRPYGKDSLLLSEISDNVRVSLPNPIRSFLSYHILWRETFLNPENHKTENSRRICTEYYHK